MNRIIKWFKDMRSTDPVYKCKVYKTVGCAHVDGYPCDMKTCNILRELLDSEIQCPVCGYYCLGNGGHGCIDKPNLVYTSKGDNP